MGAEALVGSTPAWGLSSGRGEVLLEAFSTTRSPQQVRPDGPPARGIRRLVKWLKKPSPMIVPAVLVTAVIAAPLPISVDRHPSSTTPVQRVVASHAAITAIHDEVKYVPEYLTMAQIHELDELFALPTGPEDIIHLDE